VNRRLYRCRHDKRIAGVASGLAEYFDLDVSLVRVVWFVSFFVGGVGLLLYIAMAIVGPVAPDPGTRPVTRPVKRPAPPPRGGTRHRSRIGTRRTAPAVERRSSG